MCPIITHEDELILAKSEKNLVEELKKLAKTQSAVISAQRKLAETISKNVIARESLNRTMRDVLKQMQTLARENRSNIKDDEVNYYQDIVNKNDEIIQGNKNWMEAIKDLTSRKEIMIGKKIEFADALMDVADKRAGVIKKALNVEKTKNKMIEGDKLELLDQQLNDSQRIFDTSREVFLKKVQQFLEAKAELTGLWSKLKDSIQDLS